MITPATGFVPAIIEGRTRPLVTDPGASLLGDQERRALLAAFDAAAARGGFEGDEVARFERELAARIGAAHAIAVSSATTGLQLLLTSAGVGAGAEVLVPAHTFPASAHAVIHAGARPVFVDVDRDTLCLDPGRVHEAVTEHTRAILVVHIGGKPARMPEIIDVASRHGLAVVEDAAQAHGATLAGRHVGTFGLGGVFSFSPKLMTSFRGGAIVTDDPLIADRCRQLRFHGFSPEREGAGRQTPGGRRFVHHVAGYSAAMTALQAAMLIPQLGQLEDQVRRRHDNAVRFAAGLASIGGFRPVPGVQGSRGNYYMLEAFFDPEHFGGLPRDLAAEALLSEGVPVSPVALAHMLAPDNPSLEHCRAMPHPVAVAFRDEGLVFGHPLQSLFLSGDPSYVTEALERVALIKASADRIAAVSDGTHEAG